MIVEDLPVCYAYAITSQPAIHRCEIEGAMYVRRCVGQIDPKSKGYEVVSEGVASGGVTRSDQVGFRSGKGAKEFVLLVVLEPEALVESVVTDISCVTNIEFHEESPILQTRWAERH